MATSAPTTASLLALRDIIVKDPLALQKWAQAVDHMVASSPADGLRIKAALKDGSFEEAVLQSLRVFFGGGGTRVDLAAILAGVGINAVAGQIQEPEARSTHVRQTEADGESALWRQVGKLISNFSGRTHVLGTLHSRLHAPENRTPGTANLITITGLGGVGKSTLARKYAYDYRNCYGGNVIWINAETVESMRASFIRLANAIGLNLGDQPPDALLVEEVFAHFKNKCLVILDNVEDKSDYRRFLPEIHNPDHEMPYVLVTSRRTDFNPLPLNEIRLDVLEMKEAVELVQKILPKSKREDALILADKLQRLPLALQQALAFIRDQHFDDDGAILEYLKQFDKSEAELLSDVRFRDHNDYSSTTFATWEITLARISKMTDGELAIQVINALAYLNPDSISVSFVRTIFEDEADAMRGLKLLERFSMVRVSDGKVAIHRLVQHVVRPSFCEREEEVLQKIAEAVQREFRKEDYKLNEVKRECTSHGLHLFSFQMSHKDSEAVTTNCGYFGDICYFLDEYGNYDEALSVSQQMAALYESVKGEEHESTIRMKWRMADAYSYMDKYSEALPILNSILPVAKSTLGSEHRVTMNIQSRLANDLSLTGDSVKALRIYNEMIPVAERVYGESENVLVHKNNKARALRWLRKYDQALELLQHVLEKRITLYGENDVRTLRTKSQIAFVHDDKREYSKALRIWEEVEVGYGKALGDTHPSMVVVRKRISICKEELARRERSNCQML